MRTRFAKLVALMMIVMLALTGCSLIEIDQEMDMAEVVATVNGTKITKGQVINDYYYMINLYTSYGYTVDNELLQFIKEDVIDMYVLQEVLKQKAVELSLIDLDNPETFAQADADAAAYFEELLAEHTEHVNTNGLTEEAARAKLIAHMEAEGTTLEAVQNVYRDQYISEVVQEYVESSLEVTEDEIVAAYNEKVAADEAQYTNSTYLFETHNIYGYEMAWKPEGYRTVKHILFVTSDEQTAAQEAITDQIAEVDAAIAALNTESTEETASEAPAKTLDELNAEKAALEQQLADLNAEIIASFKEKTDSVYARLEAGESFDALMAELGEDPGMKNEPNLTTGYFVSANSSSWDVNFRDAAMALENIGDVSQPILSTSGVHIIYYHSDVAAGAVDMETLRDSLTEALLATKSEEAYTALCAEWMNAATIKTYPKVLK